MPKIHNLEPINYDDFETIRIPVSVKGFKYTLTEATGKAAVDYRNAALACTKLGPTGKPSSIVGLGGLEPLLVSLCLTDNANSDRPVPKQTIMSWPARIQSSLFTRAKQISDLGEDNPEKDLLKKFLTQPDSPVSFDQLKEYVDNTDADNDDWSSLRLWFREDDEDEAKNEPSGTPAGSD